jgi:hypothetical protein
MGFNRLELNITYRCNLHCKGCNRLCDRTVLDEDISEGDIDLLVTRLKNEKRRLRRIKIVGGEPTLHPDFVDICLVLSLAVKQGLIDKVVVNTNGTTLDKWKGFNPQGIIWKVSRPSRKTHRPFLWSPKDLGLVSRGPCKMVSVCGYSLDARGWLPCSAAPAIAYLFDMLDLYRPLEGPLPTEPWGMDRLCEHCIFGIEDTKMGKNLRDFPRDWEEPTPSWASALKRYEENYRDRLRQLPVRSSD